MGMGKGRTGKRGKRGRKGRRRRRRREKRRGKKCRILAENKWRLQLRVVKARCLNYSDENLISRIIGDHFRITGGPCHNQNFAFPPRTETWRTVWEKGVRVSV